jgi:hypothetical protein
LNDYEAFRRGDRFYVKIPLADLSSSLPHLRADGFDDVQVQKVGDSVVISFKLQPGASARVDQRSNRLDVIFSSPNRMSRNDGANAPTNRTPANNVSRTATNRGPDAAGPLPPDTEPVYRPRVVNAGAANLSADRTPRNSMSRANPRVETSGNANRNGQLPNGNAALKSSSPLPSPATTFSPAASHTYPPVAYASPAASVNSNSGSAATTSSGPAKANAWTAYVGRWIAVNKLATLLGALILLALILYLVLGLRGRDGDGGKAKRLKTLKTQAKVQPKLSADEDLAGASELSTTTQPSEPVSEPLAVAPIVRSAHDSSVLTKASIASPTAGHVEPLKEEEEREVFEL